MIFQATELIIKRGTTADVSQVQALHQAVTREPGALIRNSTEITEEYIREMIQKSLDRGLLLMAFVGDTLVGEVHAYSPGLYAFSHLLSDLTIAVHPDYQGKGIGRALFQRFLQTVKEAFPHILRVELFTREERANNVKFYQSLGFISEGRQEKKIRMSGNEFHTPIHMVWFNPNFNAG